jgi:hypothetical protein
MRDIVLLLCVIAGGLAFPSALSFTLKPLTARPFSIHAPVSGLRLLSVTNPNDNTLFSGPSNINQQLQNDLKEERRLRVLAEESLESQKQIFEGTRWVQFTKLPHYEMPIPIHLKVKIFHNLVGKFLRKLRPPKSIETFPLDQDGILPRCPPSLYFTTDLYGSPRTGRHQLAHLCSHSRDRAARWTSVMELIVAERIKALGKKAGSLFESIIEGYRNSLQSDREGRTGLLYQPYNNVAISCQYLLDDQPSCLFFPALSFVEMLSWDGEEYEAIFMGSEARVVREVGANNGDLLECDGEDERVLKAFSGARDATATILGLVKSYDTGGKYNSKRYDSKDVMLSRSLGAYLTRSNTTSFHFPAPENSSDFKYRIVKFSRGRALGDSADLVGHPAPIPLLLVAKSLNAWFSHLLQQNLLLDFPARTGAKFCSIFPFCGVDESDASCPVCLARMIVSGDPAFESVDDFDWDDERIKRIAANQEIVKSVASDPLLSRAASILHQVCCMALLLRPFTWCSTDCAPRGRDIVQCALVGQQARCRIAAACFLREVHRARCERLPVDSPPAGQRAGARNSREERVRGT